MSRKIVLYMLCAALAFSRPAAAEESAEDVSRRYHEAGRGCQAALPESL